MFLYKIKNVLLFFLFLINQGYSIHQIQNQKIKKLFQDKNITGTFILFNNNNNKNYFTGHNFKRAQKRMIPASTFKIPHTLIGLSVGAVKNVDEILSLWRSTSAI